MIHPEETSGILLKTKIGVLEGSVWPEIGLRLGVEENDPSELVAALRSQVDANAERLRRTREVVEMINQHLEPRATERKRRRKKII